MSQFLGGATPERPVFLGHLKTIGVGMALEFISWFYPIYHDFIPYIVIYIAKMYVKLFITSQTNIINQMNLPETDENCFLLIFLANLAKIFL